MPHLSGIISIRAIEPHDLNHSIIKAYLGQLDEYDGLRIGASGREVYAAFISTSLALHFSVNLQRAIRNLDDGVRNLCIAVNHRDTDADAGYATNTEIVDLRSLLERCEPGGIALARTVYDAVRYEVKLPYDTKPDNKDLFFACAIMRQNRNSINLLRNSAVRLPASVFEPSTPSHAMLHPRRSPFRTLLQLLRPT